MTRKKSETPEEQRNGTEIKVDKLEWFPFEKLDSFCVDLQMDKTR